MRVEARVATAGVAAEWELEGEFAAGSLEGLGGDEGELEEEDGEEGDGESWC